MAPDVPKDAQKELHMLEKGVQTWVDLEISLGRYLRYSQTQTQVHPSLMAEDWRPNNDLKISLGRPDNAYRVPGSVPAWRPQKSLVAEFISLYY